jgi:anthranilate synthase
MSDPKPSDFSFSEHSYQRYTTHGGVQISRRIHRMDHSEEFQRRLRMLDHSPGVLLSCNSEYPGRYRPRDLLVVNPPLRLSAKNRMLTLEALNARGRILLPTLAAAFEQRDGVRVLATDEQVLVSMDNVQPAADLSEEMRTRRPGLFDLIRVVITHFGSDQDRYLGIYGAFAYDLAFELEPIRRRLPRPPSQRDLVLFLPDEILLRDPESGYCELFSYDFVCADAHGRLQTTGGLKRRVSASVLPATDSHIINDEVPQSDHAPGEYAAIVRKAKTCFEQGDLFEVVPGQTFSLRNRALPSDIFQRLRTDNPAPYGALINLGDGEQLISASPEMFVRVKHGRVESCPISGTIARGRDALHDARQIRQLLNSEKDEAELSMCTDVDRNDKSRVCIPGSVRIVGRRQVELYSRLIHTVDHVQGELQAPFDALDAFLTHTWAVTVTGAPKYRAMQFLEDHEKTARGWYGGAFGFLGFDGNMDTGLTLRTIHLLDGMAHVRVGATLLMDSDPQEEEAETRLKASALLDVLQAVHKKSPALTLASVSPVPSAPTLTVLMVDHQDSFVLTLASAFRAQGASVQTLRPEAARHYLKQTQDLPDLVVLSPGPGKPSDFDCAATLALCEQRHIPVFGVCLGLQAMVEYSGGVLGVMSQAVHGRAGQITHTGSAMFEGLPLRFNAGRYHSLHALQVPACFEVTATTDTPQTCVMAVEHRQLPWSAVQFHPESLLTLEHGAGDQLIANVMALARTVRTRRSQHNAVTAQYDRQRCETNAC